MIKNPIDKKKMITKICVCGAEFSFPEVHLSYNSQIYCKDCRKKDFHGGGSPRKHNMPTNADELITKAYQEKVGIKACCKGECPVKKLAEEFGIPRWKITRRATVLGLHSKTRKEPNWSDVEIKALERNAHLSTRTIQKKLKKIGYARTETGIILKRKRMRFLQNLPGQSLTSLSFCFGVDSSVVARWIKKGLMKTQKRGTARTEDQGGDSYYIKDIWVRNFIVDNVGILDFRKIDKYWLVDLLSGGAIGTGPSKADNVIG